MRCYGHRSSKDWGRNSTKAIWKHVLWKRLLLLGMIIFQGNMLGRPKDMKAAKHAETG